MQTENHNTTMNGKRNVDVKITAIYNASYGGSDYVVLVCGSLTNVAV